MCASNVDAVEGFQYDLALQFEQDNDKKVETYTVCVVDIGAEGYKVIEIPGTDLIKIDTLSKDELISFQKEKNSKKDAEKMIGTWMIYKSEYSDGTPCVDYESGEYAGKKYYVVEFLDNGKAIEYYDYDDNRNAKSEASWEIKGDEILFHSNYECKVTFDGDDLAITRGNTGIEYYHRLTE